jgi:hypothetical protein
MKNYLFPVTILMISLFIFSCKDTEEEKRAEYQSILDSVIIDCQHEHFEYSEYVKGKINGKDFCYVNGLDRYKVGARTGFYVETTTPSFIVNEENYATISGFLDVGTFADTLFKYQDYFNILTPRWLGQHSLKEMVDRDLQVGEYLVRDDKLADTSSYLIAIWGLYPDEYNPFTLTGKIMLFSNFGSQPASYIKITKSEKSVLWGKEIYDIQGEFQCKLYFNPNCPMKGDFYGDLTEGEFKIQVAVDP